MTSVRLAGLAALSLLAACSPRARYAAGKRGA